MAFDPNKVTEVENMTAVDFGVWKSGKHAEVRSFLDGKFDIILLHFIFADQYLHFGRNVATREDSSHPGCRGLH